VCCCQGGVIHPAIRESNERQDPGNDANDLQVHHLEVLSRQRCHSLESETNSLWRCPIHITIADFSTCPSTLWRLAQHHLRQKFLARHVRHLGPPRHSTNTLVGCMLACGLERCTRETRVICGLDCVIEGFLEFLHVFSHQASHFWPAALRTAVSVGLDGLVHDN
jgi:hypothetical protein